jgi:ABC-type nickel/cobalt efflux system permease component RcnA
MTGSLLLRGMLVGLLAGLLAFGFARLFGEPAVERAIAFESGSHAEAPAPVPHSHGGGPAHTHEVAPAHSHGGGGEADPFSRATQAGFGLFTGLVVYGAAIGGLFALVFAFAQGRLGPMTPRATAAVLALAAFVALALVPWLKYPANPPSVGVAETIGPRTALYFTFMALSLAALAVSAWLAQGWRARLGGWNAGLAGAALFVAIVGVAGLVLPAIDEVPAGFSGSLLWQFRLASLGIQAVLWGALGLGFGALVERSYDVRPASAPGLPHRAF